MVPLSDAVLEIIEAQEPVDGCDFIFTSNGTTSFSGFSQNKNRLDNRLRFTDHWTIHGLRTTFVTELNELGILPHVVEACVNHISGPSKQGVAGIYNEAVYWPQRVAAMSLWADTLAAIVSGDTKTNVVPIRAGGE